MVPTKLCFEIFDIFVQFRTFVLLIRVAGCHVQMIRLQFRCLLRQKSIQLQLCNAMCISLYKQ